MNSNFEGIVETSFFLLTKGIWNLKRTTQAFDKINNDTERAGVIITKSAFWKWMNKSEIRRTKSEKPLSLSAP